MEKKTPVETGSKPDAATTTANTEPTPTPPPPPTTAANAGAQNQPSSAAQAGDEDDSDWEELDEVLDDFNKPKPTTTEKAPTPGPGRPEASAPPAEGFDEAAFLKQLEADMMANLLGGGNAAAGPGGPGVAAGDGATDAAGQEDAFDKELDELSKQLKGSGVGAEEFLRHFLAETIAPGVPGEDGDSGADVAAGASAATRTDAGADAGTSAPLPSDHPDYFQDTIRRTMDRMQESGDRATAEASDEVNEDMISQLLKAVEAGASAGGDDMDLNRMFLGMMQQLSNKELLYEPIKELNTKFGPWLAEHQDKVSAEELARYQTQARVVGEIVAKFDEAGYSDDKPEYRSYIWDRMQEMQAAGSPPEELIANPVAEELREAGSGIPRVPSDCPAQ